MVVVGRIDGMIRFDAFQANRDIVLFDHDLLGLGVDLLTDEENWHVKES